MCFQAPRLLRLRTAINLSHSGYPDRTWAFRFERAARDQNEKGCGLHGLPPRFFDGITD